MPFIEKYLIKKIMHKNIDKQFYDSFYKNLEYSDKSDYKITDRQDVKGKRILSVGCGKCEDLFYLLNDNEVWGLDSSDTAIETAKKVGIKAMVANLDNDLKLPDRYFEIVVCKDVIEHLSDATHLLNEVFRVLKDDGVLVINVPNHFYWRFRIRLLFGGNLIWKTMFHNHTKDFDEWNYMHIRFFTYRGMLKLLNLCGFKVQKGYWDFGMLAHYADPDRFTSALQSKLSSNSIQTMSHMKQVTITKFFFPIYRIINFVFPRRIRSSLVSINPGLLCASFYLRCIKSE